MSEELNVGITKVRTPLRSEIKTIRVLIGCGLFSMLIFIIWFIDPDHVGYSPVFWLLSFALTFKLLKMLHEWYHYWDPSVPVRPEMKREWKVDILTTACPGEPREMIIRTLKAMTEIRYPHTNYLCDEGNDPILKQVCKDLNIIHVTRTEKKDAKAGNINNALKQANGEIAVVLDPDHVPIPEFLDRVLPYFEDPKIGYVQCVQAYGNQEESFIARGAAEQTYHFYGPMMMCMNSYGTVQAIGANCTFRRTALDSIGGHAPGLSEDMHTAMQLHAKGWKSIYIPELLTRGLVPATLSAYYKQQLKWSRGTFDLLFHTLPKLFKNFTWRQKVHYLTLPMYFLFGLINLIDILVPVLALGLAVVPWEINIGHFASSFVPLCTLSLCIRLYAQRWLVEKHERGFHLAGGILRTATWWIFLIGFIYTIFNVKVPYIPTPKEDEHQNFVKLSVPNIIVLLICAAFIWYGLSIDWTPYSIAMASYSTISIGILSTTIFLSQQKFLKDSAAFFKNIPGYISLCNFFNSIFLKTQYLIYSVLKQGVVVLIFAFSMVFLSYNTIDENRTTENEIIEKEGGGFYFGTAFSENKKTEKITNVRSIVLNWDTAGSLPAEAMNTIRNQGALPYISWELDTVNNSLANICNGQYDNYLKKCAVLLREHKDPVFLAFSNVNKETGSSPKQFVEAWQYIYTYFTESGISNITWVWCPKNSNEEDSYPGEKFVDWIGVKCLNYGKNTKDKDWYSFAALYEPFRMAYGKFEKPMMITDFGSISGMQQKDWLNNALDDIAKRFKEVKSVILKNVQEKFTFISKGDTSIYIADFAFKDQQTQNSFYEKLKDKTFLSQQFHSPFADPTHSGSGYRSPFVKGNPGNFQLLVNGQPYYIKGVAYNTAHDWRDGNMPLTRRQLEKDLKNIKDMGANTVRRYGTGIYDRNVLNITEEYDLKVLFGFWFDPKIDFYADSEKVDKYIKEVEEKVMDYKDHSSVLAWSLGNETWGLLKHQYSKPYLTKVRNAYVQMIEHLAQRIHQLDPDRPIFSCMEHVENQLAGELVAFHDGAPSVDVIGVNSYYKEQISTLNHLAWEFDSLRPYIVSEFGPNGYWDPKFNLTANNSIREQSDEEKAKWYKEQWINYVEGNKGFNVGGFAYCWHDRMEGTYTWFGLTDFKGRTKPAYYALKEQWTNKKNDGLVKVNIITSSQLTPGTICNFSAMMYGSKNKHLHYEWMLLKNEYLEEINAVEENEDPTMVSVTIPKEPSDYRLYLFVTDENNENVSTASYPIKVSTKKLP